MIVVIIKSSAKMINIYPIDLLFKYKKKVAAIRKIALKK
jgi:hypothetical protein